MGRTLEERTPCINNKSVTDASDAGHKR